jgi:hypothetical protein
MSLTFEFTTDTPEMAELLYEISERTMRSEAAKAMNRTMTFIRKEASVDVSRRTGVKQSIIRRRIKPIRTRRASMRKLSAMGFIGEVPVLVSKMTPRPRRVGKRGVTYKTMPGKPQNPKAFYAVMASGKKSAFARKGAARLPIVEERADIGPFLRRSVRNVLRKPAKDFFDEVFFTNMQKRIDREVAKRGLARR